MIDTLTTPLTWPGFGGITVLALLALCVASLLAGAVDAIVGGDMVERPKPAPDPWLAAMGFLGVTPAETVAVDDTPTGIRSAKAAGLYVVGFKGSEIVQDTSAAD